MERDLEALLSLPDAPYDACEKQAGRVSSLSLVRYPTNDHSAPVSAGHRDVLVRGLTWMGVVISCGFGDHRPVLPLLRPGRLCVRPHSLPAAAGSRRLAPWTRLRPCRAGTCPEELGTLRRLLESRMGRRGQREFVQALRLLETFSMGEVHAAIKNFLRLGAISFDAVKRLALCRLEGRPPGLDLELYPCCGGCPV